MPDAPARPPTRVLTGTVNPTRSRVQEEAGRLVGEELTKAGCTVVRQLVVRGETENIKALVSNVSTDNEADVVVIIGGTGFGPRDEVCEALESLFERKIEGFGEAYRRLLRNDIGVHALLARATAGVFNKCVVFALSGKPNEVRFATEMLIGPTIADAFEMATGHKQASPRTS